MDRAPRNASDDELAAALLVLEQEGREALTLDHVARRLGRSQSGGGASLPWPTERWLRSDLAALGFRRLRAGIAQAIDALEPGLDTAPEKVMAAGRAYVRNAVRSPVLFGLMHEPEQVDFSHPDLARDSTAAYTELRDRTAALQTTGFEADRGTDDLARLVWETVHRLAVRWSDAALDGPVEAETIDEAIELEFTLLLGAPPRAPAEADSEVGR